MSKAVLLVLFSCLIAFSSAASFGFAPSAFSIDVEVGVWSDWIFVTTSQRPNAAMTLSLTVDNVGSCEISTNTLNFDAVRQSASFRIRPLTLDSSVSVSFTSAGDGSIDFVTPNPYVFNAGRRTISIDSLLSNSPVLKPSEPKKITLSRPSTSELTITPTATPSVVTFVPSTITIPAGATSASFVYYFPEEYIPMTALSLVYNVGGNEAAWYNQVDASAYYVATKRTLVSPSYAANALVGSTSGQLFFYMNDYVNQSFTVTPFAADTIFTPSVLNFPAGNQQAVNFSFYTSSPQAVTSTNANSRKNIYYTINGDGANQYSAPNPTTISIPRGTVTVVTPSVYIQNQPTKMSIRVATRVTADLTVTLFAANVRFNPTSVTFSASNPTTSFDVEITPFNQEDDVISFTLSGPAADYYNRPNSIPITVQRGTFVGPADWYFPALYVDRESDKFPVRVTVAPGTSVTLIPTSPDLVFIPAQLVFTPNNLQQYFTVKPAFSQTDASQSAVTNTVISFIVTGEEATLYTPPASIASTITIYRRKIEVVFSPHVYTTASATATLYLQKRYTVWATANYVDQPVTVTPVNPYLKFEPAQLQFTSGNQRIQFVVTVIAALPVGQTSAITYVISGENGGLYRNIDNTLFNPRVRPLYIASAVISPDDRVAGVEVTNPTATDLQNNHIWSFIIRSPALPEGSFTITPKATHIKFTPATSSMDTNTGQVIVLTQTKTINSGSVFVVPNQEIQANFTLEGLSSGRHDVWFELGGNDGPYYAQPSVFSLSVFVEERNSAELPSSISAAPKTTTATTTIILLVLVIVSLLL